MTFITASFVAGTTVAAKPAVLIAVSGSFKPCPVIVAVMRLPSGIIPACTHLISPASGAAHAGSTKMPSQRAMSL